MILNCILYCIQSLSPGHSLPPNNNMEMGVWSSHWPWGNLEPSVGWLPCCSWRTSDQRTVERILREETYCQADSLWWRLPPWSNPVRLQWTLFLSRSPLQWVEPSCNRESCEVGLSRKPLPLGYSPDHLPPPGHPAKLLLVMSHLFPNPTCRLYIPTGPCDIGRQSPSPTAIVLNKTCLGVFNIKSVKKQSKAKKKQSEVVQTVGSHGRSIGSMISRSGSMLITVEVESPPSTYSHRKITLDLRSVELWEEFRDASLAQHTIVS